MTVALLVYASPREVSIPGGDTDTVPMLALLVAKLRYWYSASGSEALRY